MDKLPLPSRNPGSFLKEGGDGGRIGGAWKAAVLPGHMEDPGCRGGLEELGPPNQGPFSGHCRRATPDAVAPKPTH